MSGGDLTSVGMGVGLAAAGANPPVSRRTACRPAAMAEAIVILGVATRPRVNDLQRIITMHVR